MLTTNEKQVLRKVVSMLGRKSIRGSICFEDEGYVYLGNSYFFVKVPTDLIPESLAEKIDSLNVGDKKLLGAIKRFENYVYSDAEDTLLREEGDVLYRIIVVGLLDRVKSYVFVDDKLLFGAKNFVVQAGDIYGYADQYPVLKFIMENLELYVMPCRKDANNVYLADI